MTPLIVVVPAPLSVTVTFLFDTTDCCSAITAECYGDFFYMTSLSVAMPPPLSVTVTFCLVFELSDVGMIPDYFSNDGLHEILRRPCVKECLSLVLCTAMDMVLNSFLGSLLR